MKYKSTLTMMYLAVLFLGTGLFYFYITDNIPGVALSPGENGNPITQYIFYLVLGLIWIILAIALIIFNRIQDRKTNVAPIQDKEEDENL